jgi:hypoxanthine phosphoribosyltransferase
MTNDSIRLHDKSFKKFITSAQISEATARLGNQITVDYNGKEIVFVVVLKGSTIFASDLVRAFTGSCTMEFLRAESYGSEMQSSGSVKIARFGSLDIRQKHVIIVEDIVDTGLTVQKIITYLLELEPASLRIATLFLKPDVCKGTVSPEYIGFEISPLFIVGYGLDYNEFGRNLPDVYLLQDD